VVVGWRGGGHRGDEAWALKLSDASKSPPNPSHIPLPPLHPQNKKRTQACPPLSPGTRAKHCASLRAAAPRSPIPPMAVAKKESPAFAEPSASSLSLRCGVWGLG